MTYARVLAVVLCCASTGVMAQGAKDAAKPAPPAAAAPAPVPATPERTTASFGDWTLRCEVPAAPAKRICEVALTITVQGQTAPAAQIALGKPSPTDAMQMTAVLPPSVALLSRPQVQTAKPGAPPLDLVWQRCTPGACYATISISDEAVAGLSAQTEPGKIVFKNAADREVMLPMSLRGLAPALEALKKEP